MPRIHKDEVERVKREVPLAKVCALLGIELARQGPDTLVGLCKLHENKDPSLVVTPSKNLWH